MNVVALKVLPYAIERSAKDYKTAWPFWEGALQRTSHDLLGWRAKYGAISRSRLAAPSGRRGRAFRMIVNFDSKPRVFPRQAESFIFVR